MIASCDRPTVRVSAPDTLIGISADSRTGADSAEIKRLLWKLKLATCQIRRQHDQIQQLRAQAVAQ